MPNIRTKGQGGEREVCKILVEYGLVNEASRNLDQVREGGGDVEALSHFSIEVKRHENLAIKSWWSQASASAEKLGKIPCVWWRPNRKKWLVLVPTGLVSDQYRLSSAHLTEKVHSCGKVIEPNYPHLDFIHFEYFLAWYKEEYTGKICQSCGQFEPYKNYYKSAKQPDGYTKYCQVCASIEFDLRRPVS